MKVFTGRANPELSRGITDYLDIPLGKIDIQEFSDGEIWVAFEENIRNEDVFIIQSTNPPTDNIMEYAAGQYEDPRFRLGNHEWPALLRLLDQKNSIYKN